MCLQFSRWDFGQYIVHLLTMSLQCPGSENWDLSPVAIGYAGAVRVSCMDEVAALNEKFGELPGKVEMMDVAMTDIDGRLIGLEERQVAYEESTIALHERFEEQIKELEFSLQQEKAQVRGLVNGHRNQLRMLNSFRNTITGMEGWLMILEAWRARGGMASMRRAGEVCWVGPDPGTGGGMGDVS
jgi:uncharacterized coiled-coil protein SlyX